MCLCTNLGCREPEMFKPKVKKHKCCVRVGMQYEGSLWRQRRGKWNQARGCWEDKDLCVICSSVACQSHRGWPCLELRYERDPLSWLDWVDPSHSICLRAATLPLSQLDLFHGVATWREAEEKEATWGRKCLKRGSHWGRIDNLIVLQRPGGGCGRQLGERSVEEAKNRVRC